MGKHKWTDESIEDILRQMPSVNDPREARDIYFTISRNLKKKKQIGWIVPGFASVAAILLFILLLPNLSAITNSIEDFAQETKMADQSQGKNTVDNDAVSFKMPQEEKQQESTLLTENEIQKTALYAEDIAGKELLTYAIPDRNAQNIVPISVLVDKDQSKHWFKQFVDTMPKLTEEVWGLSDYYPLNGNLTFNSEQKTVNVDLPVDHKYGMGSASEVMFRNALITVFNNRNDVNTVTFSTANQPGVILGNDEIHKIDLNVYDSAHPYYFFYVKGNAKPLLVPMQEPKPSIDEAFKAMRQEIPTHDLKASIPEELIIESITENAGTVTIFISKGSKLPQTPEMVYALEAILLTIKEFGYNKVEFKNSNITNIGPFRLDQAIEVPLAANKKEIQ